MAHKFTHENHFILQNVKKKQQFYQLFVVSVVGCRHYRLYLKTTHHSHHWMGNGMEIHFCGFGCVQNKMRRTCSKLDWVQGEEEKEEEEQTSEIIDEKTIGNEVEFNWKYCSYIKKRTHIHKKKTDERTHHNTEWRRRIKIIDTARHTLGIIMNRRSSVKNFYFIFHMHPHHHRKKNSFFFNFILQIYVPHSCAKATQNKKTLCTSNTLDIDYQMNSDSDRFSS